MSEPESDAKSSLYNDYIKLSDRVKDTLTQWVNDNDADDILLNFVDKAGITMQDFQCCDSQQASQLCEDKITNKIINIDYTIINDLHLLKRIIQSKSDKKYNLNDIKKLIVQLGEDKLYYLKELLTHINDEEYFDDDPAVSIRSGNKLVFFRKILEATIPAMQCLHDTIKNKEVLPIETKLYRVWRRPAQEKYIFGEESKYVKNITTDVFLSTSTNFEKVIEFYKNQSTVSSKDTPIIWEISMNTDINRSNHPNSQIPGSELDELVLNTGSQLKFTGEELRHTKNNLSFKVKSFVYQDHNNDDGSFYDKSKYDEAIEKFKKPRQSASKNPRQSSSKNPTQSASKKPRQTGGKNTQRKKEIMGRTRCIYKKPNDRKEYVKYKGELVTLKEFKNNFKKKS